jgi:hypothetical protein
MLKISKILTFLKVVFFYEKTVFFRLIVKLFINIYYDKSIKKKQKRVYSLFKSFFANSFPSSTPN